VNHGPGTFEPPEGAVQAEEWVLDEVPEEVVQRLTTQMGIASPYLMTDVEPLNRARLAESAMSIRTEGSKKVILLVSDEVGNLASGRHSEDTPYPSQIGNGACQ